MINETTKVLDIALHLPHQERAFLAEKLLESLDTELDFPLSEEWRREIVRRCEQLDRGEVEMISAEEAFRKAFEALS